MCLSEATNGDAERTTASSSDTQLGFARSDANHRPCGRHGQKRQRHIDCRGIGKIIKMPLASKEEFIIFYL